MRNRLLALEEAYVTIFEEYSPFFNAPVVPRSRTIGQYGWQFDYDLTLYPDLALFDRPVPNKPQPLNVRPITPRTVSARWVDVYMRDLRWERTPRTVEASNTGLPFVQPLAYGTEGQLSFSAAHFSDQLARMIGYNRFYRIFVDVKKNRESPAEESFMFCGGFAKSNSIGESPIGYGRSFVCKELPEGSALWTLDRDYRYDKAGHKNGPLDANGVVIENIAADILEIAQSRYAWLASGQNFMLSIDQGPATRGGSFRWTYNGYHVDNVDWVRGRVFQIDGWEAGLLTIVISGDAPPALGSADVIALYS